MAQKGTSKGEKQSTVKAQPKPVKGERKARVPREMATPEQITDLAKMFNALAGQLSTLAGIGRTMPRKSVAAAIKFADRKFDAVNAIIDKPSPAEKQAEREAKKAEREKAREEKKAKRTAERAAAKLAKAQQKFADSLAEMNRLRAAQGLPQIDASGKEITTK